MNQEIGSIIKYFYDLFPCKVYEKEVPENFEIPSLYFPRPFAFDSNDSLNTFMNTYTMPVKLFHHDTIKSNEVAERIANTIRRKKNVIQMVDEEGNKVNQFIRFSRVETRIEDSGVSTIILNWSSRYHYDREEYTPLESIEFKNEVK